MSLGKVKLIAFDLDGTLLNSVPDLTVAVSAAMEELGFDTISEEQVSHWLGNGAEMLLSRAICRDINVSESLDRDLLAKGREIFDRAYAQNGHELSHLYPTVRETLETLHQQGYKMALVTNKPSEFVPGILEKMGIASLFVDVIGGEDFPKRKPDPMSLNWLMEKHGVGQAEMLMVGDSRTDIKTAKNAGCHSFGLTYGYNHGESILDANPDYVADQLVDLLEILPDQA